VEWIEKNVTREQVAQARELGKDPASGKPVTVRMGRYGPFVQIGTKDDEEKPRFAGLRPGQKMDSLTLADAMDLFQLPRTLGTTSDGEKIVANVGRFGPYVKYGSKYVSLKEDDPYTVTLEKALEVIRAKQEADANRIIADFGTDGIQVLNGRYGPYVTDGKKNAKIPKDRDPKSLTLEECRTLIEQAPERGGRFGRGKRGAAPRQAGGNGKSPTNGASGTAESAATTKPTKAAKTKRPRPASPAATGSPPRPLGSAKATGARTAARTAAAAKSAAKKSAKTAAPRKSSKSGGSRSRNAKP